MNEEKEKARQENLGMDISQWLTVNRQKKKKEKNSNRKRDYQYRSWKVK